MLRQAQAEMLDWQGTGCSVMEVSHRGREFEACIDAAEHSLRRLLEIPSNYKVLFLQGGGSMQWSQILFNLCRDNARGDFILTGRMDDARGQRSAPALAAVGRRRSHRRIERGQKVQLHPV